MKPPKALMILTELETLIPGGELRSIVDLAVMAEDAGFDAVMLSEHIALGPTANAKGLPRNPREYAAPGNQDPMMSWPSSMLMASAIAARTSSIRIVLGAIIAPLRHPVALAKDLATLDRLAEGRLVFQPTVSWHRDEYDALGVDFTRRGRILDEVLDAMALLWSGSPASFDGEFFNFSDVYSEPKPWRPTGPRMWVGGQSMHPPLLRRIVRFADGFHPFGSPSPEDLERLREAMAAAGRSIDDLELIGGTRATFESSDSVASLELAMASIPAQMKAGYSTFCMKPSQHTDDVSDVPQLCREMVERLAAFAERVSDG